MGRYYAPNYDARKFKPGEAVIHTTGLEAEVALMSKRGWVTLREQGGKIVAVVHAAGLRHKTQEEEE
jgi:hypothetical protein